MNAHNPPLKIDRAYALARLGPMCETLAAAKGDDRAALLRDYSREMGGYVRDRLLGTREFASRLWDAADKSGLVRDMPAQEAQRLFEKSIDEGVKGVIPSTPVQAPVTVVAPPVATARAPAAVDPPTSPPAAQNAKGATLAPTAPSQCASVPTPIGTPASIAVAGADCEAVKQLRAALLAQGFVPIAVRTGGKAPPNVGWNNRADGDACLPVTLGVHNTGVRCNGLRPIDVDVEDRERTRRVYELALAKLGPAPMRQRENSVRFTLLYRAAEGEPKKRSIVSRTFKCADDKFEKVEVLGAGQQFVAYGTHPTGAELRWEPKGPLEVSRDALIPVTEEQIDTFLAEAAKIIDGPPPTAPAQTQPPAPAPRNGDGQAFTPLPMPAPPRELTPDDIAYMENIARCSLDNIANAPRGTSNDTINREARTLSGIAVQLPSDDAEKLYDNALAVALARAAKGGNDPGETRKTFDSGWRSGWGNPLPLKAGPGAEAKEAARASVAPLLAKFNAEQATKQVGVVIKQKPAPGGVAKSDAAYVSSNEAWPEPKPIPSGLSPVRSLELDYLPASIAPWVADIAGRLQCPLDFVAIPAVVALGATLGRKIGIRPQRLTDWLEVPNMWGCIIGRPGVLKSPAMQQVIKPLKSLEASARAANDEAEKNYRKSAALHKLRQEEATKKAREAIKKGQPLGNVFEDDEPEPPAARRYLTNDTSYEALGEILATNPNGVMAFRDELVSLLKTLDREEYAAARGFFLSAWNGNDSYTFDRIVRGRTHIEAACLSLLGSTQPGRIAEYMRRAIAGGAADDGLIQRFGLLVWPDQSPEWKDIDRYPDSPARQAAWRTFGSFDSIDPMRIGAERDEFESVPFLRFGDAAQDIFIDWRSDLEKRLRGGELHPALESHFSKYRKLVPSLALINHLADEGGGPVSEAAIRRAIAFVEYLETHAIRAYSAGIEAEAAAAKAISKRIKNGDLKDRFTARELWRNQWTGLTDLDTVKAGLELLTDLHWLDATEIKTNGRPRVTYAINPKAGR